MSRRNAIGALGTLLVLGSCAFDGAGLGMGREAGVHDRTGGGEQLPPRDWALDGRSDAARIDGALDGSRDVRTPDVLAPDTRRPDTWTPETWTPDTWTPDVLAPDLPQKPAILIYADALASDWSDWSWGAQIDLGATSPVKVGSRAVRATFQAWGGFSPRKGTSLSTAGYAALAFWVHGGTGSDKPLRVSTQTGDSSGIGTDVAVTAVANTWTAVSVPLASLGNPATIKRINIQSSSAGAQPSVTFDELRLAP